MFSNITTERLYLHDLSTNDAVFIDALVNTPNWLKFIGDRHVKSTDDATKYIQKILDNPNAQYKIVRLKNTSTPIGVVTFLQRDYLAHPDIGFAFLPQFAKKGYAYEATKAVLNRLKHELAPPQYVLATTLKNNVNSIQLLEKLGLAFDKEIVVGNDTLMLYAMEI